ncbi:MAG: SufD family Fe-S cluster assembly protein [Burkholderiaceae bacterium]|nr:SufD family Fe-S cluster assembly protein [Burkholderiaceae bacterium]
MTDLQPMLDAFAVAGEDPVALLTPDTAHLVAYGHDLASQQSIPGVMVLATSTPHCIEARIDVDAGVRVAQPVHLCFGLLDPRGAQMVRLDLTLGAGAAVTVWSHCLFTRVESAKHLMQAAIFVGEGATLEFQESHYHGDSGGIEVRAPAAVKLAPRARFRADFSLLHGRVGLLDLDYTVDAGERAVAELISRVYGTGNDAIRIRERVDLNGASSHAIVKSRVALRDDATAEIVGATHGNAPHARGHVDCTEIVRDRAVVRAVPEVSVTHPLAKVTHEAAIGAVDTKQLETLMARGLAPDEAVDILVRGMLR